MYADVASPEERVNVLFEPLAEQLIGALFVLFPLTYELFYRNAAGCVNQKRGGRG